MELGFGFCLESLIVTCVESSHSVRTVTRVESFGKKRDSSRWVESPSFLNVTRVQSLPQVTLSLLASQNTHSYKKGGRSFRYWLCTVDFCSYSFGLLVG